LGLCIHKFILVKNLKPLCYFGTIKKNPNVEQLLYHMVAVLDIAQIGQVTVPVSLYACIRALIGPNPDRTSAVLKEIFLSPSRKTLGIASNASLPLPSKSFSFHDSSVILLLVAVQSRERQRRKVSHKRRNGLHLT
jgi:hypothetical protein